jgi:hypothetical protein
LTIAARLPDGPVARLPRALLARFFDGPFLEFVR